MTDNDLELRAAVSNENEKLQAENAKLNERLDMTGRANFQLRSENAKLQEQLEEWVGKTAEKAKACCDLREERDQLRENLHKQISYAVSVEVMRDQLHERLTRLEGLCRDYAGQYSESESCVVAPGRAICAEVKSWASEPAKEPELAACPWCQGSDIIINDNGPVRERTAPDSFWCECVSCHCEGPIAQGEFASASEAVIRWNRRIVLAEDAEFREACVSMAAGTLDYQAFRTQVARRFPEAKS